MVLLGQHCRRVLSCLFAVALNAVRCWCVSRCVWLLCRTVCLPKASAINNDERHPVLLPSRVPLLCDLVPALWGSHAAVSLSQRVCLDWCRVVFCACACVAAFVSCLVESSEVLYVVPLAKRKRLAEVSVCVCMYAPPLLPRPCVGKVCLWRNVFDYFDF